MSHLSLRPTARVEELYVKAFFSNRSYQVERPKDENLAYVHDATELLLGKVTMLFQAMDQISARALEPHGLHNQRYGYAIFLTGALHFGQHLGQARLHTVDTWIATGIGQGVRDRYTTIPGKQDKTFTFDA